ncbi:MAG: hypothetical protein WC538_20430 [Thermoanaerobaculia bacterium]
MKETNGLSARLRMLVLLLLLATAPVARAADPSSDPSWIDIVQQWFEALVGDDDPPDESDGVIHFPGG